MFNLFSLEGPLVITLMTFILDLHVISISICVDINECLINPSTCGDHGRCVNMIPGYKCNCDPGYDLDPSGMECVGELCLEIIGV